MADDADLLSDEHDEEGFGPWAWSQFKTWVPAILIVLGIRTSIAEPFRIPSGSMIPDPGDRGPPAW